MAAYSSKLLQIYPLPVTETSKNLTHSTFHKIPTNSKPITLFAAKLEHVQVQVQEEENGKFKWVEITPKNMSEQQKQAIAQLPSNMMNRCKAVLRQIICFSSQKGCLQDLLSEWVRIMKPRRSDWLAVLKELKLSQHILYSMVAEFALLEESFEANVRDYTKLIHYYGKQKQFHDAESTFLNMKKRGFECDQVTLTTMIDLYSKSGNLKLAEETFEELKLICESLDKRSYGSMIMAYIRAGVPEKGEVLLREMDVQEIRAGTEVYKALLRAYSMSGDTEGAQRLFNAIQYAGIAPDVRICALIINAYQIAGQSQKAYTAFENMRKAGLEPSDKCVALVLLAYEKENQLNTALEFLIDLEKEGYAIGKEASEILAKWFRRLGVVEEVELILREYSGSH